MNGNESPVRARTRRMRKKLGRTRLETLNTFIMVKQKGPPDERRPALFPELTPAYRVKSDQGHGQDAQYHNFLGVETGIARI